MTDDRILVCDPDPRMQRALRVVFRAAGYRVLIAASGEAALERVAQERPRAVILELKLPDLGGLELCRRLRERGVMPILVVSVIDDERAKVGALESGADDYVTKPFSPAELVARLAARLRAAPSELRFEAGGLVIDIPAHQVTVDGAAVHLTATEFAVLRALVTSRGAVTHQVLAKQVWGAPEGATVPQLRAHIANLRAKLDPDGSRKLIATEIGVGYRFNARRHSDSARHAGRGSCAA